MACYDNPKYGENSLGSRSRSSALYHNFHETCDMRIIRDGSMQRKSAGHGKICQLLSVNETTPKSPKSSECVLRFYEMGPSMNCPGLRPLLLL